MANFSAAFGYDFYIMPLTAANVDVSTVTGTAATFLSTTAPYDTGDSVAYASGIFTVDGNAFAMDGTVDGNTTADAPIKLLGLTSASLETETGTEEVYTYDDDASGFSQSLATTKGFSLTLAGVADFSDAGYKILRLTEQNTVADNLRVKFLRTGPTGTTEAIFGYGTLTGYTESNEVTNVVSWECTLTGYGPYALNLES
jgi:hypothetical protein